MLIAALATSLPLATLAQDIVGSAMIKGRIAKLYADGTWEFADLAGSADGLETCQSIAKGVSFCEAPGGYERIPFSGNPQVSAAFQLDDRNYLMFVHENLGAADGMSAQLVFQNALDTAAEFSGIGREDVPVLDAFSSRVDGRASESLAYHATLDGLSLVYHVTVTVGEDFTLSTYTYGVSSGDTADLRSKHEDALGGVKISK